MKNFLISSTILMSVACAAHAFAADDKAAPKTPASWADGITFTGVADAGGTWNSGDQKDNHNFGRLTDDKPGVQLNQILLTAARPIDPTLKDYD